MKKIKRRIELCQPCGGMWYADGYCPLHNAAPVDDAFTVPSRSRHNRFIFKIWIGCIFASFVVFLMTGGVTLTLYLLGVDTPKILVTSTIAFQILVLSYGMGFFVPAFCTSLLKMGLGVEMSRQGLEIGRQTAEHIGFLQAELQRLVGDAQSVVKPLRELVEDFKGKPSEIFNKVIDYVEKLEKDGTVETLAKGIKDVSQKIGKVIDKEKKKAIDDEIDKL